MHRKTGSWNLPRPAMGEGRIQEEKGHDSVGSKEEGQRAKAARVSVPGSMDQMGPKRKITWGNLWRMEPFRIYFLLRR